MKSVDPVSRAQQHSVYFHAIAFNRPEHSKWFKIDYVLVDQFISIHKKRVTDVSRMLSHTRFDQRFESQPSFTPRADGTV